MIRNLTSNLALAWLVAGILMLVPNANAQLQQLQKVKKEGSQEAKQRLRLLQLRDPHTGKIPEGIRTKELTYVLSTPSFEKQLKGKNGQVIEAATWNRRGPYNVGGRTRALAIDRTNENIILAGGVSGGMWRSTDGGASWTQTTGASQSKSVTDVYQDPNNTDVWYYVSGERRGNSASGAGGQAPYRGTGVYKSTDGGITWVNLSNLDANVFTSGLQYCYRVRVDPTNSDVYVAAFDGIYRSTDGGSNFATVLAGPSANFSDIEISATGVIYATLGSASTSNKGVFKSTNGTNWTDITPSLAAGYQRITLDVAPSNENIIYIFAHTPNAGKNDHQVFYTSNAGTSWTDRSSNLPAYGSPVGNLSQGSYNQYIKIKPDNPNVVFIGSTNLYRTTNGFTSTAGNSWIGGYATANNVSTYANHHPDNHSLVFYPSNPARMLTGHDGGVSRTTNNLANSVSWTLLSNGYYTTQAYHIAIDPETANDARLMVGLQDNGKWTATSFTANAAWGEERAGGDGCYVAIVSGQNIRYTSTQGGNILRFTGANINNPSDADGIQPAGVEGQLFVNPFILDKNDQNIMYYPASGRIYRNTNLSAINSGYTFDGTSTGWTSLSGSNVGYTTAQLNIINGIAYGEAITALDVSKTNVANVLYYGTTDGRVFRLDGANSGNPSKVDIYTNKGLPNGAYVSNISVDPTNSANVIVVFSNYGIKSVFYTTNSGSSWTDISGNLEQNPDGSGNGPSVRWAEIHQDSNGNFVYLVGTSTGLYSTETLNGTATVWEQEGPNTIGNVPVVAIQGRTSDNLVAIGTHGNGVYSATVTSSAPAPSCGTPGGLSASSVTSSSATLGWNSVSGASNYDVRYRQQGTSSWTNVNGVSGTSRNISGLSANTTYEFQVRANCTVAGSYSSSTTFSTSAGVPTTCTSGVNYSESFESNFGAWNQSTSDDLDFIRQSGSTRSTNTGPSSANDGSNYIYVESSTNGVGFPNKVAILTSDCFDLSGVSNPEFVFDYHMYGVNINNLVAEVSTNGGSSWTQIFTKSGDQGNSWFTETIDVSAYAGTNVSFRFTATTGTSYRSDIALDNIRIQSGSGNGGGGVAPTGYCTAAGGSTSDEWIQRVQLGSIDNNSGANGGYGDFTAQQTNLALGASASITLTAAWSGRTYNEGFAVWIDYNRDGDFADPGERVIASENPSTTSPISGSFTVPATASAGLTRMRVVMSYNAVPTDPCAGFDWGEIEDYTVNLVSGAGTNVSGSSNEAGTVTQSTFNTTYNPEGVKGIVASAYPNPAVNFTTVKVQARIGTQVKMLMMDVNGIGLVSKQRTSETGEVVERFDTSKLKSGLYLIKVWNGAQTKILKVMK
ncbi:hypothetical protein BKI52_02910 [marine bacterium AO1-C]|nr:hypothetical protein BKI52_02910 [marine bacterium AO1-C]